MKSHTTTGIILMQKIASVLREKERLVRPKLTVMERWWISSLSVGVKSPMIFSCSADIHAGPKLRSLGKRSFAYYLSEQQRIVYSVVSCSRSHLGNWQDLADTRLDERVDKNGQGASEKYGWPVF
jgi:hypothetical protein